MTTVHHPFEFKIKSLYDSQIIKWITSEWLFVVEIAFKYTYFKV